MHNARVDAVLLAIYRGNKGNGIEVSDEVAAFLEEDKRLQINYAQYIRDNKAFYSLDAGDGIEAGGR